MPKPKIYIDSCCFIDMAKLAKGIPLDTDRANDVWYCNRILDAARAGEVVVYSSMMSVIECTGIREKQGDELDKSDEVQRLFKGMLLSGKSGVIPVQPHPLIFEAARDLSWTHDVHLKPADALHVATALDMKCDEFFTSDTKSIGVTKRKALQSKFNLRLCFPRETALLPIQYKQLKIDEIKTDKPQTEDPATGSW